MVQRRSPIAQGLEPMILGNVPKDGGNLLLNSQELDSLNLTPEQQSKFIRPILGSSEFIRGAKRYCVWINDKDLGEAIGITQIHERIEEVRRVRLASPDKGANDLAVRAHQFREMNEATQHAIIVPRVSSERRLFLPVGLLSSFETISDSAFGIYDGSLTSFAILSSTTHLIWAKAVCGQLETRIRYSNTLGWNTFPLPALTEKNRADLMRCAEDILLAREAHFPATIADLYDPEAMPDDLRAAHGRNDEVLERIYIGRRFKNDTERLEKLFDLYSRMTSRSEGVQ